MRSADMLCCQTMGTAQDQGTLWNRTAKSWTAWMSGCHLSKESLGAPLKLRQRSNWCQRVNQKVCLGEGLCVTFTLRGRGPRMSKESLPIDQHEAIRASREAKRVGEKE